jgi:hypothetical protein
VSGMGKPWWTSIWMAGQQLGRDRVRYGEALGFEEGCKYRVRYSEWRKYGTL